MVVCAVLSGIPGCRRQPNNAREPVRCLEDGEVPSGGAEELSGKDGPEVGHAQQNLCVLVFGNFLADKRIEFCQFLVQGEDFPGEAGGSSAFDAR